MENTIISLLDKKVSTLKEILRITKNVEITGKEEDAEIFFNLSEKRVSLFNILATIDSDIEKNHSNSSNNKLISLQDEVKLLSKELIALMEVENTLLPKILSKLTHNLKQINIGKNISNIYSKDNPIYGMHFDDKK